MGGETRMIREKQIGKRKVGSVTSRVLVQVQANGTDGRSKMSGDEITRQYEELSRQTRERQKLVRRRELQELKRNLGDGFDDKPVQIFTGRVGSKKTDHRSYEPWVLQRRKLTIGEFRGAVKSGSFQRVHLEARGPFFFVEGEPHVEPRRGTVHEDSRMLLVVERDRKQRLFQNPAHALEMLWEMGVKHVEIHMEDWQPKETELLSKPRPDMAKRLKFAHEYGGAADNKV
jgi:hypothetical protein